MAHYKRKKPRIRSGSSRIDRARSACLPAGRNRYFPASPPAWFDVALNRGFRRSQARLCRAAALAAEPGDIVWPVRRSEASWYW